MDDAKIIHADMCKLRTACNLTDRPHAVRRRLQPFVYFDVSTIGQFDSSQVQSERLSVWDAASRHEHMTALHSFLTSVLVHNGTHGIARLPGQFLDPRGQKNVHALVLKQGTKSFTHVLVFF